MAKVLVIRKSDKTIHKVPLSNKASLMAFSNRLPDDKKWKFEEMEEDEANELPYIDENYVTAADAQQKASELTVVVEEKDALIKELEAKLLALNGAANAETAATKIAKINGAANAEEVTTILADDTRVSVIDAATKKIAAFTK